MANIRRKKTKSGVSYQITVTAGRGLDGKQLRHYKTYTPLASWSVKKQEREAVKVANAFEQSVLQGFELDNKITFKEYCDRIISQLEYRGRKHRTIDKYQELTKRIYPAIGHLKLPDIRASHLNKLYAELSKPGARLGAARSTAKIDLDALLKERGLTKTAVAEAAGVAQNTVLSAVRGNKIASTKAEAIAKALNVKFRDAFTTEDKQEPLSSTTVVKYHRLIHMVLAQADKEMLVPYNAADKATPPAEQEHAAEYYQPEDIDRIREALEGQPLKWRVIVHLLLITGCRRGEIAGLQWAKVDFENNRLLINNALSYTKAKGTYSDTPKTKKPRYVALPAETMALLKTYRAWYNEQRLKMGEYWTYTDYLFVQDNGMPMNPTSITAWLNKFYKAHDLPHLAPHRFRHTHASLLYFSGMDSITISKRLGHAKVSTTTDIYAHLIEQADVIAAENVADAVLRPKKAIS